MFKPEDLPPELPAEARALLATIKPEPPELLARRKKLLAEIDAQLSSAQGAFRVLLTATRAVILGLQPEEPFHSKLSAEFARAAERYAKDPASPKSPPPILTESMNYLRERLESMGLGALVQTVAAADTRSKR